MKPEEAAVKVLSNAKTAVGGVVLAGRISVGAVDIIEGAFQVSFPGNFITLKYRLIFKKFCWLLIQQKSTFLLYHILLLIAQERNRL